MKIQPVTEANKKRITMLIHGRQGSGKTLLGASVAEECKTLLLDTTGEWGVETLRSLPYAGNIDVVAVSSVDILNEVYTLLEGGKHPYKAVVLDSASALQSLFWKRIIGRSDHTMMDFSSEIVAFRIQDWGSMLDMMRDVFDYYYSLASMARENPIHVIMTAQSNVKDDSLGETPDKLIRPAIQGGAYDRLVAAPDYVVYTFIEENYDSVSDEPEMMYRVRIGPHPNIVTKVRTDPDKNKELMVEKPILGDSSKRVTIPKLVKLFGKEL